MTGTEMGKLTSVLSQFVIGGTVDGGASWVETDIGRTREKSHTLGSSVCRGRTTVGGSVVDTIMPQQSLSTWADCICITP